MKQPHRILEYPTVYDKDFIVREKSGKFLNYADDKVFLDHLLFY
ncbi:hypothetical protein R5O11_13600 [Tenacibaculum maritimum]